MRRFTPHSLPQQLPIFPLEGALLLPRARLPLNIFEPRYLAMLDEVLASEHRLIGMIQPKENSPAPALYGTGCAGRLTSFSETEDGRYVISLTGVCRFRVAEEIPDRAPFRRVRADWSGFLKDLEPDKTELSEDERKAFMALLRSYFQAMKLSANWDALSGAEEEMLVNSLSMMCPFSPHEKQALLEAGDIAERRHNLQALMRFSLAAPAGRSDLQ